MIEDAVTGVVVVQMGVVGRGEGDKLTLKIPLEAVCFLQEGGKSFLAGRYFFGDFSQEGLGFAASVNRWLRCGPLYRNSTKIMLPLNRQHRAAIHAGGGHFSDAQELVTDKS